MKKKTFTVHYSITGGYDVEVEADNADEAIELAEETLDKNWYPYAFFDMDVFQVTNEKGEVVWGMS